MKSKENEEKPLASAPVSQEMKDDLIFISEKEECSEATVVRAALRNYIQEYKRSHPEYYE